MDDFDGAWIMVLPFVAGILLLIGLMGLVNNSNRSEYNHFKQNCADADAILGSDGTDYRVIGGVNDTNHCIIIKDGKINEIKVGD
jgi:hypothetical protein